MEPEETTAAVLEGADKDLASPEGATRWQGAIALGEFAESDPEAIWPLVEKWGSSADEDIRTAIATCVLEHILEHHFEPFFTRAARLIRGGSAEFADTFWRCWRSGKANEPANASRFDLLENEARELVRKSGLESTAG